MERNNRIQTNETVLFLTSDNRSLFEEARGDRSIRLGNKLQCGLGPVVGCAYGRVFEVQNKSLCLLPPDAGLFPDNVALAASAPGSSSNQHFADTNSAQSLTQNCIAQLKDDPSISGSDIIDQIGAYQV